MANIQINYQNPIEKLPKPAKTVRLFLNNDPFFVGRKIVIDRRRHIKDMDILYNYATDILRPRFGAVRNIYTPDSGTRVENLAEFQHNHNYVASGFQPFKELEGIKYNEIGKKQPTRIKKTYSHIKPVNHGRFQNVSGRWKQAANEINHPVQLWLHVNGDANSKPVKLLLPARILRLPWDMILEYVTDRVGFRLGCAVRKLYNCDGELIEGNRDLISGQTYIACGYGRLRNPNIYRDGQTMGSPRKELKRKPLPPIGVKKSNRAKSAYRKDEELKNNMSDVKDDFDNMVTNMKGGKGKKAGKKGTNDLGEAEQETFKPKGKGKGSTNAQAEVQPEKATKTKPNSKTKGK